MVVFIVTVLVNRLFSQSWVWIAVGDDGMAG